MEVQLQSQLPSVRIQNGAHLLHINRVVGHLLLSRTAEAFQAGIWSSAPMHAGSSWQLHAAQAPPPTTAWQAHLNEHDHPGM